VLQWNAPVSTFTLGDRVFCVSLNDAIFNLGLFGLSEGECYGATVKAKVKQISSTSPVPDTGGTLLLLGLSVSAIALLAKNSASRVHSY
jgi:hypothetical protein